MSMDKSSVVKPGSNFRLPKKGGGGICLPTLKVGGGFRLPTVKVGGSFRLPTLKVGGGFRLQ